MEFGIAHDAAFADLLPSHFELRLDQRQTLRPGLHYGRNSRKKESERNERRIDCHEIDQFAEVREFEKSRVQFNRPNSRIVPYLPIELLYIDVQCVHAVRAVQQQKMGEASGRGARSEERRVGERV